MSPLNLRNELIRIGRILNRWQAEIRAVLLAAAALAGVWLLTLSDLVFRYQRAGRLAAWLLLITGLAAGIWHVIAALMARRTPEGVAARLESVFPKLDNHLINTVQFSRPETTDLMAKQYVEHNAPDWTVIKVRALRDRKKHWQAYTALGLAGLVLIVSGAWVGGAWNNALARVVNPFSGRPPSTLATILGVTPGNSAILKGKALELACKVTGKKGQKVYLDLWPDDDKRSVMQLGYLTGAKEENYTYQIPRVATGYKYRFRIGDALSERFTVLALPPLAFSKLEFTITPPQNRLGQGNADQAQTADRRFNGLAATHAVYQDSILTFDLMCNRKLAAATVTATNPVALQSSDRGQSWSGQVFLASTHPLLIMARDEYGGTAEANLKIEIIPDKPPVIRVIAPTVRMRLAAGAAPRIQWEVSDDCGLSSVRLELIATARRETDKNPAAGTPVQTWSPNGARLFATNWNGAGKSFNMAEPLAFQIVAQDNRAGYQSNLTVSAPIVFEWSSPSNVVAQTDTAYAKLADTIKSLVERQRVNLEKTTRLETVQQTAKSAEWQETEKAQQVIREMTGKLIADPGKPLGALVGPVKKIYNGAMTEVIDVLNRLGFADPVKKASLIKRAILLEATILRVLTNVNDGIDDVKRHRNVTGLLSMLDALVNGQTAAIEGTSAGLNNPAGIDKALVGKQRRLAGDLTEFVRVCRETSKSEASDDPEFSKLLVRAADDSESKKIAANMLRAAEQLEHKTPAKAAPFQKDALTALKALQELMNTWRLQKGSENTEKLREALQSAGKKLEKMIKIEQETLAAVREISRQKDKSGKETDQLEEMMEEEVDEIQDNLKKSAMQMATDLAILPEVPVGNELIEDVYQVFEEVEQEKGSEKASSKITKGEGQYNKTNVEAIKSALEKKLKDMEYLKTNMQEKEVWLASKPPAKDRTLKGVQDPKNDLSSIPLSPLLSEVNDLIGDLLKQQEAAIDEEEPAGAANDPGPVGLESTGGEVAELSEAGYQGKGKSANLTPEHKKLGGRSIVGRQGMSDGETSAGSGKINEGDNKLEKRMSQDSAQSGQVKEEGHAKAEATGGGKQSGYGDETGMVGSGPRRESQITQESERGLQAMLKKNTQALYARAELAHVRTGSLDEAIRWMQQAEDAIAKEYPIQQVREFQRKAVMALKKSQTELGGAAMEVADTRAPAAPPIDEQLAGTRDEAPAAYRDLVSEYFKSLSAAP